MLSVLSDFLVCLVPTHPPLLVHELMFICSGRLSRSHTRRGCGVYRVAEQYWQFGGLQVMVVMWTVEASALELECFGDVVVVAFPPVGAKALSFI